MLYLHGNLLQDLEIKEKNIHIASSSQQPKTLIILILLKKLYLSYPLPLLQTSASSVSTGPLNI